MPVLANLHAEIAAIAAVSPPRESFEFSGDRCDVWRAKARSRVLELLHYTAPVPLASEVLERRDLGTHIREKIAFYSTPWSRVPAYVLSPAGLSGRAPAIVALHCHGGYYMHGKEKLVALEQESAHLTEYRQKAYGARAIADALAQRGYVVMVIDAFYFGERRLQMSQMPPELVKEMQRRAKYKTGVEGINEQYHYLEELMARHLFAAGVTWMGLLSHDDRASVDYLLTRPDVDSQRIGCIGLSMGGMRTNWLHATDPRIRASVSVGWMTDWRELLPAHIGSHSWAQVVPGFPGAFELSDLAVMGEGEFLVQSCAQDSLFSLAGMQHTAARIGKLFAKAGQSERFEARIYDVPHEFNPQMQTEAFAWLDQRLLPGQVV